MAIDIPILVDYDRDPAGTSGGVEVDNIPVGATCHAFAVGFLQGPIPPIVEVGNAVGPGPLDITLDLHTFVWSFFGVSIAQPISVFLMNEIGGNFSAPSAHAMPVLWDTSYGVSIDSIYRMDDGTTVAVDISDIEDGGSLIMCWTNWDGSLGVYELNNRHNEIPGFTWGHPYNFIFINFNHRVQLGNVQAGKEGDYRICQIITL